MLERLSTAEWSTYMKWLFGVSFVVYMLVATPISYFWEGPDPLLKAVVTGGVFVTGGVAAHVIAMRRVSAMRADKP